MTLESLSNTKAEMIPPALASKRPHTLPADPLSNHFFEIRNRLNAGPQAQGAVLDIQPALSHVQDFSRRDSMRTEISGYSEAPLARIADTRRSTPNNHSFGLPRAIQHFQSPIDIGSSEKAYEYPTRVYVSTSRTVHQELPGISENYEE